MSIYLQDPDVTILQGDSLELLRSLPSESVHMACTSPPFYGLRDYGTGSWEGGDPDCDHTPPVPEPIAYNNGQGQAYTTNNQNWNKKGRQYQGDTCGKCGAARVDQQIGLEAAPDEWVARLVEVFRELRRVLRSDGTFWCEIGDSFANKDLIGAPWLLAFALRADGWYLRSEIIWAKPNPMPESVSDRPTQSHSRVFLLTKSPRYFYDAEALREPNNEHWLANWERNGHRTPAGKHQAEAVRNDGERHNAGVGYHPAGRNRRSVWTIATQPYPEAHFATWPEKLVEPMILAGCPEGGVCPECGAPWERVTDVEYRPLGDPAAQNAEARAQAGGSDGVYGGPQSMPLGRAEKNVTTIGWQPTCDCFVSDEQFRAHHWDPVPATILDPFGGAGTTAVVARRLNRKAILLELNPDYCALAAKRLAQQSLFAV